MKKFFFLCLLYFAFVPFAAIADNMPGHLSGLVGQLIKANKAQLSAPTGNEKNVELIKQAYKKIKQRSLHRFAGKGVKNSESFENLAQTTGFSNAEDKQQLKAAFPDILSGGAKRDKALKELYDKSGRDYPAADDLKNLQTQIDNAINSAPKGLEKIHIIELDDGEKVEFNWNPEQNEFAVTVINRNGDDEDYITEIKAKTTNKLGEDGTTLTTDIDPEKTSIVAKDAQQLQQEVRDILGNWVDDDGTIWIISGKNIKTGAISVARLRGNKPGDEETFANGSFTRGIINASRNHDDIRDMDNGLPEPIKASLASSVHPQVKVQFKLTTDPESGKLRFSGTRTELLVTYDPNSLTNSIRANFAGKSSCG